MDSDLSVNANAYRDYRMKGQLPSSKYQKQQPSSVSQDTSSAAAVPSIEFVCRRLTMKFEPVLNVVYRDLLCRCISCGRGTPSNIIPETIILRGTTCPRHNKIGATFRDYGDHSLPCHKDPYFARFGGYNAFWALLHRRFPEIFDELNGASRISESDLIRGNIINVQNIIDRPQWIQDVTYDHWFDLADEMRARAKTLPPWMEDNYLRKEKKRTERGIEKIPQKEEVDSALIEKQRKNFSEFVMGRESREISTGSWGDKPHWKLAG